MTQFTEDLSKVVDTQLKQLCNIRKCSAATALSDMAATYTENLRDSWDTSMEGYWRAALAIVDERIRLQPAYPGRERT